MSAEGTRNFGLISPFPPEINKEDKILQLTLHDFVSFLIKFPHFCLYQILTSIAERISLYIPGYEAYRTAFILE